MRKFQLYFYQKMEKSKLNEIDPHNLTDRSFSNSASQSKRRLQRTNNNSFFNFNAKIKKNQLKKQLNSADQNTSVRYTPLKKALTCQIPHSPLRQDLLHKTAVNLDPKKLQTDILRKSGVQGDKTGNKDSDDYYKFWKSKANEYQQANFNLHRINSALEQQLEIVKHHNQKLQRKVEKQVIPTFRETFNDPLQKQKVEKFYSLKIQALTKKIEEQEIIIKKQDQKIKQLSRQMSENFKLKNLLENMEDKVSEMNSVDDQRSIRSSKRDSIKKIIMPPNLRIGSNSKDITNKTLRKANTYRFYVPDSPSINNFQAAHNDTLSVEEQIEPCLQKSKSNHNLKNRFMSETEIGMKFNLF